MNAFCLSAEQVQSCWEDFAHHITRYERVCQELTATQIREAASLSKMQIWGLQTPTCVAGIVVTEIQHTARGLICLVVVACGSAPENDKRLLMDELTAWARQIGCVAVKVQGRKGWLRWDRRFKPTGIIAEITL